MTNPKSTAAHLANQVMTTMDDIEHIHMHMKFPDVPLFFVRLQQFSRKGHAKSPKFISTLKYAHAAKYATNSH
jgi:hypothetical protein